MLPKKKYRFSAVEDHDNPSAGDRKSRNVGLSRDLGISKRGSRNLNPFCVERCPFLTSRAPGEPTLALDAGHLFGTDDPDFAGTV